MIEANITGKTIVFSDIRLIKVNKDRQLLSFNYFCIMNRRNSPGKLGMIRFTMIVAQILLVGFTIHWLNLQFSEHEKRLSGDLEVAWNESQQQMIDSLLLKEYINPAMDSSRNFNYHIEFNSDSLRSIEQLQISAEKSCNVQPIILPKVHIPPMHLPGPPPGHQKIIVQVTDSVRINDIPPPIRHNTIRTKDLVLQGVKLFVNEISDSTNSFTDFTSQWSFDTDTAYIISSFNKKVKELAPMLHVSWIKHDSILVWPVDKKFTYQIHSESDTLEAKVGGYNLYILKKLLPQIGFALVLILLTALAFIGSFRSLRTQVLLNTQRNDFIRNMSHELKTPVATVKVALEALKRFNRKDDPKLMDEYLDMANSEANRLELLISRVMSVSDTNEAYLLNKEQVNVQDLIRQVVSSLTPRMDSLQTKLEVMLPESPIFLMLDSLHIQGVVINIIDNGLKYSNEQPEIRIDMSTLGNVVIISIADRGIGIPEIYRKKIFEKFFRVPTGVQHNVKGYGLGLSYSDHIMKLHGGRIECLPREEGGSIFRLIFPDLTL